MKKPHIVVTEPEYFTKDSIARMRKVGRVTAKRFTPAQLLSEAPKIDVLVVKVETLVTKKFIAAAKNLQCVISATTGSNHIDMEALEARSIPLELMHGEHSSSTAEHALALMLAAARNIPQAHVAMQKGEWDRWRFIGTELKGKTLGLFGFGRIGKELAKRAKALEMNIIASDPVVSAPDMKKSGAKKVTFDQLLKESDVISLHAPLIKPTYHAFNWAAFKKMKKSAILVNAARGELVDDKAFLRALEAGEIRGAANDVYATVPAPKNHPYRAYARKHSNLILTTHLGGSAREALEASCGMVATHIERMFKRK